jgi:hypothetical protein
MWSTLAQKVGEPWKVVEAKVSLSTAKETLPTY